MTARSSALECSSLVSFLVAENEMTTELYNELKVAFEEISKMLFAMIKNLEKEPT